MQQYLFVLRIHILICTCTADVEMYSVDTYISVENIQLIFKT